VPLR